MQIPRHWRLNALRYRLQGVRYEGGKVSLQARPTPLNHEGDKAQPTEAHHTLHAAKETATTAA